MDSTVHYTSVSHAGTLMATINKMRVNSDLCDVTVVVGEYRIMAHKIILSATAPFFYQMMQLHSQPQSQSLSEVQLNNIDEIAALKIIEFCYTSVISLDDETVWPLLAASIKFQLPEICSFCCEFLVAGLDTSNCILSLRLAAKVHCPQLEENCVRFLLENIEQVCVSHGLMSLTTPDLYSLLSVLALHDVGPATMAQLVGVWMEDDWLLRRDSVFGQLVQVFPNMAQFLHRFVQQSPHLRFKDRDGNNKANQEDKDCKPDEGIEEANISEAIKLTGSAGKNTSLQTSPLNRCFHPNGDNPQRERQDRGRHHHEKENTEEGPTTKGSSVFGIGASREFICISCGDDFDCEEDLVSHQNECDESARMVGNVSGGDGLRGVIVSRKSDDELDEGCDKECEEKGEGLENNDDGLKGNGLNVGSQGENGSVDGEESRCEKLSSNREDVGDKVVELCCEQSKEIISDSADDGKRLARKRSRKIDDENKTTEAVNVQEKTTPAKKGKVGYLENEREEEGNCTNDDNNNDINSSDEGLGKDDNLDLKNCHSLTTWPDVLPYVGTHCDSYKNNISPDISPSSHPRTENHFKTPKLSNLYRWQEKNKYASSLVNLTSQGSSLRPQHKCQLCGKAFWEKKHLSQHWMLDHGIKSKTNDDDEQEQYQPWKAKESKSSPSKEIQADIMALSSHSNLWPFSNHLRHPMLDSDSVFKSDSHFRSQSGSESLRSSNGDLKTAFQEDVDKRLLGSPKEQDTRTTLDGSLRDEILPGRDFKPQNSMDSSKETSQIFNHIGTSANGDRDNPVKKAKDNPDLNVPLPPGTFALPGQSLAPSDLLTDYINHYNKLAQWLSQGPNFCPTCLVYHTNGNPCPVAMERPQRAIKMEKKEVKDEVDEEVNVDGDVEDGPLDMSKTSLDLSVNILSSSSPSTSSHFLPGLPSTLGMPPYYNYAHFMQGNSIIDMSTAAAAAAMKAANTGSVPGQTQNQDTTSVHSVSPHFVRGEGAFSSYHPFPASITASANVNGKNTCTVSSPQNDLSSTAPVSSNNNISSSPSSSLFSFLSASPNMPTSLASQSGGGKKKSTPQKQGFPCTVCNRVYSHQSALFTHMRSHSPSTRTYRCQFCNENFARAPDLKVHVCPSGIEKPFTCPSCGQTFAKNIHLKRHLATHSGLKPYPCWICGKRFSRSDHLKRHTQSIHAGARPHACQVCSKEFVRKYELNKHMASHNP